MESLEKGKSKEDSWLMQRLPGLVILLISLGVGFYFVGRPLLTMLRQEPKVLYSTEGVLISFCLFLFGLVYTALGHERVDRLIGQATNLRITIVLIIVFGTIIGFYFFWNAVLRFFGYR